MNYRFEPTGEVRVPKAGEYYGNSNSVIQCDIDFEHVTVTIFRRVPHEDTSCEVAFARMVQANYQNPHWFNAMSDPSFHDLVCKFCEGERSPELTALMVQLTERMKGSV